MNDVQKVHYTLKDYDGVSAKSGNPANTSIVYSTQHIEKSANESLYKLDFETRGVLFHELVHAYQFEPKGIGSLFNQQNILGLVSKGWRMQSVPRPDISI